MVSIVTSVYNKAKYLHRFFDSVLSQDYKNIEIVCVDNASTDDSLSIIRDYSNKDSRIKVVCLTVNKGPSDGYFNAFKNAVGEYVTVVDADDFIDRDYIGKLVYAIESVNADVAMCLNDLVWDDGRIYHKDWPTTAINVIDGSSARLLVHQLLDERSCNYFGFPMPEIGGIWNKLYRREWLVNKGIHYETNLWKWCDFVFNIKVMKQVDKLIYINTAVYHFFQSESSVTRSSCFDSSFFSKQYLAANRILEEIKNYNVPGVRNAFSVYAFRVTRDFFYYYQSYVGKEIPYCEFKGAIRELNKQPFFKALRNNIISSDISKTDKILVISLSLRTTFFYKVLLLLRSFKNKITN